jgi:hypothetical protein
MMMNAVTTARRLDWEGWFLGIMSAVISGFAGVLGSGIGVSVADPEHFNFTGTGLHHLILATVIAGGVSSAVSLGKFLQTQPVPGQLSQALGQAAAATKEAGAATKEAGAAIAKAQDAEVPKV